MKITAPCLGCPDREIGCHGNCEKYISFTEENEREKERRQTYLHNEAVCNNFRREMINKTKRR